MRLLRATGVSLIIASPLSAQAVSSLAAPADTVAAQATQASTDAANALALAQQTAANAVTSVNGTTPINGAVTLDVVRTAAIANFITNAALTNYSTTAQTSAAISTAVAAVPVYTDAQAVAANASALNGLAASTVSFVASGAFISQATMRGTYPCVAGSLGKYARVNDMYGTVASVAICETDGTSYYWRPQRTDYASNIAIATGAVTLTPFVTAPIVYLPTTPTGGVTINLSTTNVWPGASFHIYAPASLGLGTINLANLVGGGTVPLVQGSDKIVTYTSSGWKSN